MYFFASRAGRDAAAPVSAAQFTASLAVRSTHAPPGTRAHVFVTMAGLKVGCSALGAALAGAVLSLGPRPTLLMIASLVLAGAAVATVMRMRANKTPQPD